MDDLPPRTEIPTRTTRAQLRSVPPPPAQRPSRPIGGAIAGLLVGAWCLIFAHWVQLGIPALQIVEGIGFLATAQGLILTGISVNEILERRRRRG